MAMSTAERQARYRQRLKDAANGVTPAMVREAAEIVYRWSRTLDGEPYDWAGLIDSCHRKRGGNRWIEMIPDDPRPEMYDFIEDESERRLVERVAAVGNAVLYPPER